MHGGKRATVAEKDRMSRFEHIGCIACRIRGIVLSGAIECHHLKDTQERLGHSQTVPLCSYHHSGVLPDGITRKLANEHFGPSFHPAGTYGGSKPFRAEFGADDSLLAMTNDLLGV